MHLLLTDRLACPRCGPAFGLILMADRLAERRIAEGSLGCANCRERYPVREGVADLRPPPRSEPRAVTAGPEPTDDAVTAAAAALGVGGSRLPVLLLGDAGDLAAALARIVPEDVEVAVARSDGVAGGGEGWPGVSRLLVGDTLPFFNGSIGGVALRGPDAAAGLLREAARVLAGGHRIVVLDPPDDAQTRLGAAGLTRFVRGPGLAAGGR